VNVAPAASTFAAAVTIIDIMPTTIATAWRAEKQCSRIVLTALAAADVHKTRPHHWGLGTLWLRAEGRLLPLRVIKDV
jgi:hypothetical protein